VEISFRGRFLRLVDRACNLCGSRQSRLIGRKKGVLTAYDFGIVICAQCGFVFVNPGLEDTSLIALYDQDYYRGEGFDCCASYLSQTDEVQEHPCYRSDHIASRLAALLRRVGVSGKDLLDVGCGLGNFVKEFNQLGFHACGIETSSFAVQKCRDQGLDVIEGQISADGFGGRKFDVITLFEVIEHLSDPMSVIKQAALLLKPGGVIHVQTGNVDHAFSYLRRIDRAVRCLGSREAHAENRSRMFDPIHWGYFSLEGHVSYFSPRTLAYLYKKCGLEPVPLPPVRTSGRFPRFLISQKQMPFGRKPL
jgi:SAM-dependent methyltransferase